MKSIFRLISFLCLAAAVGVGVYDSIRSVSTSSVDLLSTRDVWFQYFPSSLAMVQAGFDHYIHPEAWRWLENGLSMVPAFAVFLALSLLFWMAGYSKRRALGRFSA